MYSVYCKNRSQSEALINESTESQAFFKGIQMKLAHQLSLDSYLLKPVQRITKYQLLLKVSLIYYSCSYIYSTSDLSTVEPWLKLMFSYIVWGANIERCEMYGV